MKLALCKGGFHLLRTLYTLSEVAARRLCVVAAGENDATAAMLLLPSSDDGVRYTLSMVVDDCASCKFPGRKRK